MDDENLSQLIFADIILITDLLLEVHKCNPKSMIPTNKEKEKCTWEYTSQCIYLQGVSK